MERSAAARLRARCVAIAVRGVVGLTLASGIACGAGGRAEGPASPAADRAAKRAAPVEVTPVVRSGTRYEAVPWGKARGLPQNGGYLAAVDEASGRELWLVRVYETRYDPALEADKQDVFISRLRLGCGGDCVEVEDERGGRYRVDLASRTVTPR